ncbi:hypothetical protein FKN01_04250 [Streptomyces sp. 130]|uniref:DUF6153 family protein n=1 Tax=Streptomyces sp. 130 TaxID=2591006 RepID=UPI00117DFF2C|nr:DUF6153 family protein [Streptomyces sp. 130]TRV80965.1 hypothetical protein FKN01_04250 [Streptomyces sp. 130]
MASSAPRSSRRPAGRLFVLLVLAVLAGLLGMHALAPGGAPQSPRAEAGHHGTAMATATEDASHPLPGCSPTDGGSEHLAHADGSCVAAGTETSYAPPPLAGALSDAPVAAVAPRRTAASAESGRAPPDLSELQLLRI